MDGLLESIALRDAAALENAFYDLKGKSAYDLKGLEAIEECDGDVDDDDDDDDCNKYHSQH